MARPRKPKPFQRPKMMMGAGLSLPNPKNLINLRDSVDPSSMVWHHMSRENQLKMYNSLVKKTNQRLRELEKQGMTDSAIYTSLKSKGYRTKTGNVGFSTEGSTKWSSATLKREYSKVFNAYKAPTSSSSKQAYRERMEEQLAHIGIDYDELMKNPDENIELLREFWSLVNEGDRVGLWDKFGLGSYEAQEVVKEFMKDRDSMPKAGRGAHQVALGALKKVEKIENDAAQQPNRTLDAVKQEKLVTNYDSDKMKSARDSLLNKLAVHKYGTKPIEKSFENLSDEEKEYLLF